MMTPRRPLDSLTPAQRRSGDLRSRLRAYIVEQGLKQSRQRELVAEAFFAAPGHVSAEELVGRARALDPRVSVATVYRTLKLLEHGGLASPLDFGDGQTRWESAVGRAHHDHLVCTRCGAVVEFASERIEQLQARVARRHGFTVDSHRLELYGACADCGEREAPSAPTEGRT